MDFLYIEKIGNSMNIFALDSDPVKAAMFHSDKHVVKMILETAQILSTVKRKYGWDTTYRPTHQNHPCTLWAGRTKENYLWLRDLGRALSTEYHRRYGKTHKSQSLFFGELGLPPQDMPDGPLEPFAMAMPDACKHDDPVEAYRNYYQLKTDQHTWMAWAKLNNTPAWIRKPNEDKGAN